MGNSKQQAATVFNYQITKFLNYQIPVWTRLISMKETWLSHAKITGTALKNWFVAQCFDAAAVALLWLVGLLIIGIPWAPLWALLAGILQFVPNFGGPIAVVIPAILGAL